MLIICKCHLALLAPSLHGGDFFLLVLVLPPPSHCPGVKLMAGHARYPGHKHSSPPVPACVAMGECAGCEGAQARSGYVVLRAQGKPWLAGVSLDQRRRHVAGLSVLQVSHSPDDKPQANGDEIRNWQHAVRRD